MASSSTAVSSSGRQAAAAFLRVVELLTVTRKVRQYVHGECAKANDAYRRTEARTRDAERRVPKLVFLNAELALQLQVLARLVAQLSDAHNDAFVAYEVRVCARRPTGPHALTGLLLWPLWPMRLRWCRTWTSAWWRPRPTWTRRWRP